jgi:hypothetical protein
MEILRKIQLSHNISKKNVFYSTDSLIHALKQGSLISLTIDIRMHTCTEASELKNFSL